MRLSTRTKRTAAVLATAHTTAALLRLLGAAGRVEGVQVHASFFAVEVIPECTALFPAAMYAAAVLAYPGPWRAKALGVGLGLPALFVLNQVRMVSLFYVGHLAPDTFETVHLVVWQSAIVIAFMCTILVLILADKQRRVDAAVPG